MNNSYSRNRLPVLVGFIVGALSLVYVLTAATISIDELASTSRQMDASHSAIAAAEELLLDLNRAESSGRGYALTGQDQYLGDFREAESATNEALGKLRGNGPLSQQHIEKIRGLVSQ